MHKHYDSSPCETQTTRWALDVLTICASVFIAAVTIQTSLAPYEAGTGDHHGHLPAGLLRADSSLYLGDYFIREAVMPHWFFEYLTMLASRADQLSMLFFIFWLVTISVFAHANLLIAKIVMKRNVHLTALVIMTAQIMGVRTMFGTSALILNQALPHSLAAAVTFLILALWLCGNRKHLFVLLPFVPIIHIQIGAIALGLVILLVIGERYQGLRPKLMSLISIGLAGATTLFGLILRPVAGNTKEFSEICERLIPHHCYAPSWNNVEIALCIVFIVLGLCTALLGCDEKTSKAFRSIVIGIPVAVLATSLILDRFGDGLLTDLVRGNNIYRLAVVVIPFLYWSPLLIWKSHKKSIISITGSILSVCLLMVMVMLPGHGSRFEATPVLAFWFMATTGAAFWCRRFVKTSILNPSLLIVAVLSLFSAGAITFNERSFELPDIQFIPDEQQRAVGEAIRKSVPRGNVVAGDPISYWLRMDSGVGYAVDCKFRPIGGGQPLKEFYKRLQPLGGYEEACLNYSFGSVSPDELTKFAKISDAQLLLLTSTDNRINILLSIGWEKLETPDLEAVGYALLEIKN